MRDLIEAAPPPTRGCTWMEIGQMVRVEGSPAHAGMHPLWEVVPRIVIGLPRPRDDVGGELRR